MAFLVYIYKHYPLCPIIDNSSKVYKKNNYQWYRSKELVHTWNHKLLTMRLSKKSGNTHTVPKVRDKNGFVQDHTVTPIPGEWPNIIVNKYLRKGRSPHSKIKILAQKTPPFRAQHCIVRFNTLDSLQYIDLSTSIFS